MIRTQDLILLAVTFSTIALAVIFPGFCLLFAPYPLYCMMGLLFLSFLSIPVKSIFTLAQHSRLLIVHLLFVKLLLVPISVYFLFRWIFPKYAVAALLLSAISPGVVSPFFSEMLLSNTPLVAVGMVIGSLLAPITLPSLVKLLAGAAIPISFAAMAHLLSMVIFVPFSLSEIVKRVLPQTTGKLIEHRFNASLVLFALSNFGVFSKYADYLRQQPSTILIAFLVSVVLAVFYFGTAIVCSWNLALPEQLAMIISTSQVNNVLVLVFASSLFGPTEPMVAAMYSIMFFSLVVPIRAYQNWRLARAKT